MVLGKLPVPGRPTILITVGQGPIALAVGAGGGGLDIITLIYPSSLSPSLWETARYRLKYCLKGPLNPKQPTNQPIKSLTKNFAKIEAVKIYTQIFSAICGTAPTFNKIVESHSLFLTSLTSHGSLLYSLFLTSLTSHGSMLLLTVNYVTFQWFSKGLFSKYTEDVNTVDSRYLELEGTL